MLSIILFTLAVVLAAVARLRLHSNLKLQWRSPHVRTPHWVIKPLHDSGLQPRLKACFIFTLKFLYTVLAEKQMRFQVYVTLQVSLVLLVVGIY